MTITDLVSLKLKLKNISTSMLDSIIADLNFDLERIIDSAQHASFDQSKLEMKQTSDTLINTSTKINQIVKNFIIQIDNEIDHITKDCLARGYMMPNGYGSAECGMLDEKYRTMQLSEDQKSKIIVVARKYTDWRFPVLEIGPGDGEWTDHLVAGDPLYIVDIHKEFLDSTLNRFNNVYRNRIRPYLIQSNNDPERRFVDLKNLPINQFGFIFSWNVFNYCPLRETKTYLEEAFKLLRPGGVMMFTYNNCDTLTCAGLFENGMKSWMPESLLINTCKELGFEIINSVTEESEVNWIEIRKPGELKTVKAHQVLGRIVPVGY